MAEPDLLEAARRAYDGMAWAAARDAFELAEDRIRLSGDDLRTYATTLYMTGDVGGMLAALERAHRVYLDDGDELPAAGTAVWLAANYAAYGKPGPAVGWLQRGEELLEQFDDETVVHGWMVIPAMARSERSGEFEKLARMAGRAIDLGHQFEDRDLVAMAQQMQGRALLRLGRISDGLQTLDTVMLAVVGGELSPQITGIVYCSVIEGCYEVQEIRRGRDWTAALSSWCDQQADLVAFTDQCFAHRAEIRRYEGRWDEALSEAARSHSRNARGQIAAQAFYQQAEVQRLRGEYAAAEASYRHVSDSGGDPQPGLALLRLAMGDSEAARASIRRSLAEAQEPFDRARVLSASIEILVATDDLGEAESASEALTEIAKATQIDIHVAAAHTGRGRWLLASERPEEAISALRSALTLWIDLDMPYETARTKVTLGQALRALGDDDTARFELEGALRRLEQLGAAEARRLGELVEAKADHGLSKRELEVLRLMATGMTNRGIANELVLSERTIDRHVSNIFTKLGVTSRTAAAAFAYQHDLT